MTIPALFAAFFCLADPYGTDSNAESLLASKPPECPEEWYLDFTRTGDRQRCGKPYGERIDHLEKLIALECKEGKGRFTAKIAEYMEAIMTEKSWTISAHDPDLTSWNGTVPHVDLGCARRGQAFCDALHYLGKSLPAETVARARENVERRMFRPYLATVHGAAIKQHWWYHTRNNWNAACNFYMVSTAVYLLDDPNLRAECIELAEFKKVREGNNVDEIKAAMENGGVINDHHGIGLKLSRLMKEQYGPAMQVFEGLKRELDPNGIMNPFKLGL